MGSVQLADASPVTALRPILRSSPLLIPLLAPHIWQLLRGVSQPGSYRQALVNVLVLQALLIWASTVSAVVDEPYLDEVFHIPQAQRYCQGRFAEWDPKITTPPGLYLLSVFLAKAAKYSHLSWLYSCEEVADLRFVNVLATVVVWLLAERCRHQVETHQRKPAASGKYLVRTKYAGHTALNAVLFPLVFFFSGLYYTDVVSTAAVLLAFSNSLARIQRGCSSLFSDVFTVLLGITALFMRQTNVFWLVVFMGGLEAVHAVKNLQPASTMKGAGSTWREATKLRAVRYSEGYVHDTPLQEACPDAMLLCVISLSIAAVCNPARLLRQTWPYIAMLVGFGVFVLWNGSVVLGDKSNHVATVHLAQMLYIWPFFVFFSLPLAFPYAWQGLIFLCKASGIVGGHTHDNADGPAQQSCENQGGNASNRYGRGSSSPLGQLNLKNRTRFRTLFWLGSLTSAVLLSLATVKYNTIIHPFTLADNRHYMFYVFRYTIRRGGWVRYGLVLPYCLCGLMIWGVTSGFSALSSNQSEAGRDATSNGGASCHGTVGPGQQTPQPEPLSLSTSSISTSTAILFLLATSLSLITAPLVEPRYFLTPWVIWRLLIPAWRPSEQEVRELLPTRYRDGNRLVRWSQEYDVRLFLETSWFVLINAVTGYMFLYRPFAWKAEDGTVLEDGRLQRFMW